MKSSTLIKQILISQKQDKNLGIKEYSDEIFCEKKQMKRVFSNFSNSRLTDALNNSCKVSTVN